jgi:peptidyl-prolyl cis-trans isomerase D
MLRFMRKHQRSFIVKGVFVILILVFIGWGVGTYDPAQQTAAVAVVNGIDVTVAELNQAHQNLLRAYQELYGAAYSPEAIRQLDLQGRALDELITTALLEGEGRRLGLRVTDEEVADAIRSMGVFSPDGRFDKGVYLRFLRLSQITDAEFVAQQRRSLLTRRVEKLVTDGVRISDDEIRDRYLVENQRVNVRYLKVPWAPRRDAVTLSDDDLARHYEANPDRYRVPERVTFDYVLYGAERFANVAEVGEDDVKQYYDAHAAERFTDPAQVELRQLVLVVPEGASDEQREQVRARARELARQAADADFAALAKRHSAHAASAANGGELGWVARSDLDPVLADAAFALEEGGVSAPVELPQAIYILKAEATRGPGRRPLEDARADIERALRAERGRALARAAAEEDAAKVAAGTTLEELASARGLAVERSKPLSAQDVDPAFGPAAPAVTVALKLAPGEASDVVEIGGGFVLLRPAEIIPAAVPPLEEVRPRIEADLRVERAREQARTEAETILGELRAGKTLDEIAGERQLTVEETGAFGILGRAVPGLGLLDQFKEDVFALTPESPIAPRVYETGAGDAVVAVLAERVAPDLGELESKRDTLRDSYLQRKKQALLKTFIMGLKQQASIQVRSDLLPQT